MRFQSLFDSLQNSTNVKINKAELGRIIGLSRSGVDYNLKNNTLIDETDVQKIETFYNVNLLGNNIISNNTINILPVCASCGNGITIDTSLIYNYDEKAKYIFTEASGSSMNPVIFDKDIVIAKKYDGHIIQDGIYLFSIKDDMFIKRLSKNINQLECISDNPAFDKIVLKGDEMDTVNILGKVCGIIRRF